MTTARDMAENDPNIEALIQAVELLTHTTATMEESYRRLEAQVRDLDRELAEKNRELSFTSEYLGNLLESMTDGVIAVDQEERILRFNRAAGKILGYRAEEVVGRPFESVFCRRFVAPKHPAHQELRTKTGRMTPVSERDSPVSDSENRRLGSVKTFQDLSELIALREQLRQVDRLAAVGEMAATVAHEIRNPLGGIRGFAAFLKEDTPSDDPRRRLIDKILVGVESLDKVVTGLLEYTRPVELDLRPVSCQTVLAAALNFLDYDAKRITIRNELDPRLKILADGEKIRQVLLNILLNAVQSIAGEGTVSISSRAEATQVAVLVRDTGSGIGLDELKRIFNPFYTTKEKGTGLGLAVCAKIVEAHGGNIEATSRPEEGSTFEIRLPRAE